MQQRLNNVLLYLSGPRLAEVCRGHAVNANAPDDAAVALAAKGITVEGLLNDLTEEEISLLHMIHCDCMSYWERQVTTRAIVDAIEHPADHHDGVDEKSA